MSETVFKRVPGPAIGVDVGPLKLVGLAVVVDSRRRQEPGGTLETVRVGHAARRLPRAPCGGVVLVIRLAQHPPATSAAAPLTLWPARSERRRAFLELAVLVPSGARLCRFDAASRGLEVERCAPTRASRGLRGLCRALCLPRGAPANVDRADRRRRRGRGRRRRGGGGAG